MRLITLHYLGSKVSNRGDGEEEILVRFSKASQVFASPRGTWRSKNIRQKKKIGFFKSNFLSILLFGAESMKMTKTPSARSLKYSRTSACAGLSIYTGPKQLQTVLWVAQKNRNITNHTASSAKEMEMDWFQQVDDGGRKGGRPK